VRLQRARVGVDEGLVDVVGGELVDAPGDALVALAQLLADLVVGLSASFSVR
jgi:hypothetical protein